MSESNRAFAYGYGGYTGFPPGLIGVNTFAFSASQIPTEFQLPAVAPTRELARVVVWPDTVNDLALGYTNFVSNMAERTQGIVWNAADGTIVRTLESVADMQVTAAGTTFLREDGRAYLAITVRDPSSDSWDTKMPGVWGASGEFIRVLQAPTDVTGDDWRRGFPLAMTAGGLIATVDLDRDLQNPYSVVLVKWADDNARPTIMPDPFEPQSPDRRRFHRAIDTNAQGIMAVRENYANQQHLLFWDTLADTVSGFRVPSTVEAIDFEAMNADRQVVGSIRAGNGSARAVRYEPNGTVVPLGPDITAPLTGSRVFDVNDSGYAVGEYFDGSSRIRGYAALFAPDGTMTLLNDLPGLPVGWDLSRATSINNNMWVGGIGYFGDPPLPVPASHRAFLLHIPEPGTLVVVLAAGVVGLGRRRRREGRVG